MRPGTLLLAAVACTGDGAGTAHNGLRVELTLAPEVEPGVVTELTVRIDGVVFEAAGPDGQVSVSHAAGVDVTLIGAGVGDGDVAFDLAVGEYRDVLVAVHLRGLPAITAAGRVDDRRWELAVEPGVELEGRMTRLVVEEGIDPTLTFSLRPDRWLEGIDVDLLEEEDDGVILLDLGHNGEAYETVLDRIVETTVTLFRPPGDG